MNESESPGKNQLLSNPSGTAVSASHSSVGGSSVSSVAGVPKLVSNTGNGGHQVANKSKVMQELFGIENSNSSDLSQAPNAMTNAR